ncbi:MAG TPA: hypothetical protein DHU96_08015 [Actinobacteria bacterium]|nr:hypothetical protein [Actinomycetota bacterium]
MLARCLVDVRDPACTGSRWNRAQAKRPSRTPNTITPAIWCVVPSRRVPAISYSGHTTPVS